MSKTLQAIRGMNDILPEQSAHWHIIESQLKNIVSAYGYDEIRTPVLESTELFKRSIGEVTDIVEKEMYTFADRNGDSLTLRPEGTAAVIRACLEHGLLQRQTQRLWYCGPMYRHERPQKGRYRQFYQLGVEAFGFAGPDIDIEQLLISARFWQSLQLSDAVRLQINSLGTTEERAQHRQALNHYLNNRVDDLDEDSRRRMQTNPLRILDSKNPEMTAVIAEAPKILDYLTDESRDYFATICQQLTVHQIPFEVNPCLVRGLDYYTHTVFEWTTDQLGAQGTVCAGGRYDGLVSQLGGKACPGVGFALGLERLLLLHKTVKQANSQADIYFVNSGDACWSKASLLAEQIRTDLPHLRVILHSGGGSFKSQFKKADKSGAKLALVLAEDELASQMISVKFLRGEQPQTQVAWAQLSTYLGEVFHE